MWEKVLLFFVPFRNQIFGAFGVLSDFLIFTYSYAYSIDFYAVTYLIYIYFVQIIMFTDDTMLR